MNRDLKKLKDKHRELRIERADVEREHVRIQCRIEEDEELLEESYLRRTDVLDRLNEVEIELRKIQE